MYVPLQLEDMSHLERLPKAAKAFYSHFLATAAKLASHWQLDFRHH